MSKNRLTIVFVMIIFLLAMIPTALGDTSSTAAQYQDVEWLNFYIDQGPQVVPHLNNIAAAIEEDDYTKLYDEGYNLSVVSEANLNKSKEYNVSPELRKVKEEYEFSASDLVMAGKYFMIAVNKQNAGDIAGRDNALKSAIDYMDSCNKHLDYMIEYLDSYSNGSQTSQTSSNLVYISNLYVGSSGETSNQEYVQITNTGTTAVNMKGWIIQDDGAKHTYIFPSYTLKAKSTVTLRSGKGTNTADTLYWNKWSFIWNNEEGDTAYLYNAQGKLVSSRNG